MTAVTGSVLTANQWNTHVRNNLLELGAAKAISSGQLIVSTGANAVAARTPATQAVQATEQTTSVTYTDLTTFGPTVTCDTGSAAMVFVAATIASSTVAGYVQAGYEVSGATSLSAPAGPIINFRCDVAAANQQFRISAIDFNAGLTPGSNTFTMKYSVSTGNTGSFATRSILVVPF